MSSATLATLPDRSSDGAGSPTGWPRLVRQFGLLVAALAACWILPVLTHLIGADLLLPPLILVLTAGLIRGGRTVLDQLVLAFLLLFAATCLAAIGLTLWPWGLDPVPVAGVGLSLLVLFAAATGRRPRYHRRFTLADLLVAAGTLALLVLSGRQFFMRDIAGRLAIAGAADDFSRHFLLTDAIGQVGGYAFMRRDDVAPFMDQGAGLDTYPQGLHMVFALLDRFWRSSDTANPDGPATINMVIWSLVATFVIFGFVALWAVRRIAGPEGSGWKSVPVLGATLAYVFFGDPVALLTGGFPNEIAGLAAFMILIALVARPLRRDREQVLAVAAVLVTICFTYYLFLPAAGLIALFWLARFRRRVWRHRPTLVLALLLSAAGLTPIMANSSANNGDKLELTGFVSITDRHVLIGLMLVIAAGLLTRRALRSWAWRTVVLGIGSGLLVTAAVGAYQVLTIGKTIYYYERAFHLIMIAGLVGIAAFVRLVPDVRLDGLVGWRSRSRALAPLVALAMAPFGLLGIVLQPDSASAGGSHGTGLFRGRDGFPKAMMESAITASRTYGKDRIVVDLTAGGYANAYNTLYGSVLRRDYGPTVTWYLFLHPAKHPKTIDDLDKQVLDSRKPVLFLVSDPKARFLYFDSEKTPMNDRVHAATDTGDERAMTNVEAADYLAGKYPDRVSVVHVPPGK